MTRAPRFALISLQNSFIDFGVRYVAAACRASGIDVEVLFCLREPENFESESERFVVSDWLREGNFDAAGLSLMSLHYSRAAKLTETIRAKTSLPVLWGGVHAVIKPEQCLEWADFICAGDGEESVPLFLKNLAAGNFNAPIDNIWRREDGKFIETPRKLVENLDSIPQPDFALDHHWILRNCRIEKLTEPTMKTGFPWNLGRHYIISSRGCPYDCAYCCNTALKRVLGEKLSLRIRSVANLMSEIHFLLERYPFARAFAIMDDSFFFKPKGWVEEFCSEFKKTGAYFGVLFHPRTVQRERIKMLIDAGLIGVQMGLQSGSERISKSVFNRPETVDEFVKATKILDEFSDRFWARTYDVISDNPFETEEDQEQTIRILASLKKPFNLDVFSLTLYPGTQLYDRAVEERRISEEDTGFVDKNFITAKPTILNRLTWLTHDNPSSIVLFFLNHRKTWWGRLLFEAYYHGWEKGIRLILRLIKHKVLKK
jgi:anaerobic magnesium-protoporphyrin IX monomethyl ester cyclase